MQTIMFLEQNHLWTLTVSPNFLGCLYIHHQAWFLWSDECLTQYWYYKGIFWYLIYFLKWPYIIYSFVCLGGIKTPSNIFPHAHNQAPIKRGMNWPYGCSYNCSRGDCKEWCGLPQEKHVLCVIIENIMSIIYPLIVLR